MGDQAGAAERRNLIRVRKEKSIIYGKRISDFCTCCIAAILCICSVYLHLDKKRRQKQATLEANNHLQEQMLDNLNHDMPKEIEEIAKHPRSEEYRRISAHLARIEHFCVSVNLEIYDHSIVCEMAYGDLYGTIKSRITQLIEKQNRSGHDCYANIHRVCAWMEAEQRK